MSKYLLSVSTCFACMSLAICLVQPAMANVHYEITLQDGGISPAAMSARLHETVQIHVTNQGSKSHNLVIKDFYIFTQDLKPSEDVSLSFAPDKKGTFQYYSDTGGKPEPGMRGQLRVQ